MITKIKLEIFTVSVMLIVVSFMSTIPIKTVDAGPTDGNYETQTDWFNYDWNRRKNITIDSNDVDGQLTNFPVLVNLNSDSELANYALENGSDIMFVSSDNSTQYNHEIEFFDGSNGNLVAWVNVTSVSADSDTSFYMYYNNSDSSDQQDVSGTWSSDYIGVYHLNETYSSAEDNYVDSSSNNHHGTMSDDKAEDPYRSDGVIGGACNFSGADEGIILPELGEGIPLTLSCWVRTDSGWLTSTYDGFHTNDGILSRHYQDEGIRCRTNYNGSIITRFKINGSAYEQTNFGAPGEGTGARPGVWYYISTTVTSEQIKYMYNSTLKEVDDKSADSDTLDKATSYYWCIGASTTWQPAIESTSTFNGTIDEIRIVNNSRTPEWINASYRNQLNPGGFYTLGETEISPAINVPPENAGPYPTDGSTGISLNPSLNITVFDSNGNLMNVTFRTNKTGSWKDLGSNTSASNGVYYNFNMTDLSASTMYWWSVNTSDGAGGWDDDVYHFTTSSDEAPSISTEVPADGSGSVGVIPMLYVTVIDPEGDSMDVEWWSNSEGSWQQFGSHSSVANNTNISCMNMNFTSSGTTYYWSVNVTDGNNWQNETYSFVLQSDNFEIKWRNHNFDPYFDPDFSTLVNPVADDIDGDGVYEIFQGGRTHEGSYKSTIVCFNGSTGKVAWQKNFSTLAGFHVPMAIEDLNDDGIKEVVHAAGTYTTARHGNNGTVFWNSNEDSGWGHPAIADTDDNGVPYVFTASNSGFEASPKLRKLYGNNGTLASSASITYCCYGGVSIADLDCDGEFEVVISDAGNSYCFDEDLNTLWTTGSYTSESHCAVLINVTGDADLEVIMLDQSDSKDGIHIYHANGTVWREDADLWDDNCCHTQPSAYDIDKDGNVEIIVGFGNEGETHVFDLVDWDNETDLERGSEPPDMANVLGDSDLEILSGGCWVDAAMDVYDSNFDNVDEVGENNINHPEKFCCGMYYIVQDVDNDGYNEICIYGGGNNSAGHRNFTCYDTFAQAADPKPRTDTTFYSERRTASAVYVPKIGGKCNLTGANPSNGQTGVAITTDTINITISEPDGEALDWYITTEQAIGSNSGFSESNGSKSCSISGLVHGETYTWTVNATDGTNWYGEDFTFTVEENPYEGNDFYVNGTSGSDTNNGSFEAPWETVQHAVNSLEAGQTVYVMEGIYYGYNTPWAPAKSGAPTQWINYTNYNDDEVILDGSTDNDSVDGIFWFDNQSYIHISGFEIRNSSCSGIRISNAGGTNTHNITIDNCTIHNCSQCGIYCYAANAANGFIEYVTIENNTIHDCQNGWNHYPFAGDETLTLSNVTRFIVKDNFFYDNHIITIDAKNSVSEGFIFNNRINTTPTRRIIQDDTQWGWTNSGIYVDAYDDDASNVSVFNNIIWGNCTGYTIGTEQGGTLANISLYNNIYNGTTNGFQINNHTQIEGSHLKTNCKFINNVVSGSANICFQLTDRNESFDNLTIRNNIFDGSIGINIAEHSNLSLEWYNVDHNLFNVSSYSHYYGSNSVNGSPAFADQSNNNFRLTVDSPAINAGSDIDAPSLDYWHQSRVGVTDIGVFEYQDNVPPSFSYEFPTNQSGSVDALIEAINVTITDTSDTFNWSIELNNSDSNSGNDATSGSKTCDVTLAYGVVYTWWVNCTDGENTTNATYSFTTDNFKPFNLTDEYPVNESTDQARPPTNLSARVNGSDVDIYIYYLNMTPATDVVELLGVWVGQDSGYYNISSLINDSLTTQFIWGGTTYSWYMNVSNGTLWTNETFIYTTSGSRYDIDASDDVVATDASITWSSRSGESIYDGIYDVDDSGDITATDASIVWSNRT